MKDGGSGEESGGRNDRRSGEERRSGQDRRSGIDRRGSGCREPPSAQARPYGFREFRDRRSGQDRRLYGIDGNEWNRRSTQASGHFVSLTREELLALLADLDEQ